jgi:hypothetical protein
MKWNIQKKELTITGKKKNTYGNEYNISMAKTKLFQILKGSTVNKNRRLEKESGKSVTNGYRIGV